jgi:N-acyl-D-amino-acid deacylase
MPDLLIKNARIIDGTGKEPFKGHLMVADDKIVGIVSASSTNGDSFLKQKAKKTIDATGLALSPGFIDCHSHFDWVLPLTEHPDFTRPVVEQGITTVVTGNCGYTPAPVDDFTRTIMNDYGEFLLERPLDYEWNSMGEFIERLNNKKKNGGGLLFNNVQLVGHGALHLMAVKDKIKNPTSDELARITDEAERSLDEGAFGLSLGLQYPPGIFSTPKELEALARVAAKRDRILTVHIKALSKYSSSYPLIPLGTPHNIKAIKEILAISERAGAKLQISHFIFVGRSSWGTMDRGVAMVEKARDRGLDVMWDIYPHFGGNSYITVLLPPWFVEDFERHSTNPRSMKRLTKELNLAKWLLGFEFSDIIVMDAAYKGGEKYNGKNVQEISEMENMEPVEVFTMLVRESDGRALDLVYGFTGNEENEQYIERLMAHPLTLFETDTILKSRGFPNQASYGAFPQILGRYVRDKSVLTLADAVHRMTGKTAEQFGIPDRGTLKPGNHADLVLFDPDTIADNTTRRDSAKKPTGIDKVFINGVLTVDNGDYITGSRPGRTLTPTG